ncbi:CoA transferase family III [Novosphingobium kunmingense]|uniref:CoA transferase family III n=1 Tax=Novosphingobium kunmingense TaxID=1211806 RepID=A0A2N0H614_9SPHN|nr:CoA transferase [Novosphingobium kunmingense]PKB14367.1 CoA transferase family III [Novosphingobium kunmingense]
MIERLHAAIKPRLADLGLTPAEVLARDAPGGLERPGLISANRHCRLLRASDGWIALNLARQDDRDVIPALTGGPAGEPWSAIGAMIGDGPAGRFRDRAVELQLPVALLGEAAPMTLARVGALQVPRRVIDLSALWAGPLCAGLLARAGAEVVRIESVGRPDPTPLSSPALDKRINGGKRRIELDLSTAAGRSELVDLLETADAIVTSARPAALKRLGLEPGLFPHLAWVAITAHGFTGAGSGRVGFGDDCAVAGRLVSFEADQPRFLGDALADPLTGLEAARWVLAGRRGLIDVPMARIAAAYAAFLA